MEVCKNKNSGQYFIYIAKSGDDEALMVTPDAKVISLKLRLFDEIEEYSEEGPLQNDLVGTAQLQRYHNYRQDRSDEVLDDVWEHINKMSPFDRTAFIQRLEIMVSKK